MATDKKEKAIDINMLKGGRRMRKRSRTSKSEKKEEKKNVMYEVSISFWKLLLQTKFRWELKWQCPEKLV